MSRRDTIIVAVLVNAALLMILFATAIRSDKSEPQQKSTGELASTQPSSSAGVEEDLLNQFVSSVPTLAETSEEILSPAEEIEIAYTPPQPVKEKSVVEKPRDKTPRMPPEKPAGRFVDVTVKQGDFLEKIAKANNTSVSAIMEANSLASTQLKIGQVLKVPLSEAQPKKVIPKSTEGEYYVVKEGDNPWLIASRNNLRLEELLRLNGLDEQKARRLRPGDRLKIR